jgi:hypothetical protein
MLKTKLIVLIISFILLCVPAESGRKNRTYNRNYQTRSITYANTTKEYCIQSTVSKSGSIIKSDGQNTYAVGNLTRRTQEEIKSWIKLNYSGANINHLSTDVSPRSNVWRHLTGEHGWLYKQVNSLSMDEALYLHDASHRNIYFPHKPIEIKLENHDK